MARTRKLTVEIAGDVKGLSGALSTTDKQVGGLGAKFSGMSTRAKIALAGAGTAVFAFGKTSIDAFVQAEESQARLTDAFEKFPQLAGSSADSLREYNKELALKTKFDDDATASGQAVLAQFGLTEKQLTDITPLLQDYAARTGKDLPTAATDLGKAVLGQGRALKNVGINFKDTGTAAGNLEQLMDGLSSQVGGFAENQGKTAAGQAEILKNQFGELQEEVGSALVPALLKLSKFLTGSVLPVLRDVGSWFAEHKPVLIAVSAVIGTGLVAAFVAWATAAASAAAATIAATWPILAIGAAIAALVAGIIWAYQNWGFFRTAVDAVASFITGTLWPALQSVASFFTDTLVPAIATAIGWIRDNWKLLLAILTGPIGAAVAIIVTHWNTIKNAAMTVFNWVRDNWKLLLAILTGPIGAAVAVISAHWNTLKSGVTGVYNWFRDRFNEVVSFFSGLPNRIRIIVDRLLNQLDRLLGPLDEIVGKIGSIASGVGGVIGNIPGFASGVTNFGGGLAVVGEAGPELVNLPRGSDVIPMSGSIGAAAGGIVVNVDARGAVGLTGPALEKWFRDVIVNAVNRDGRIPGTNIAKAVP